MLRTGVLWALLALVRCAAAQEMPPPAKVKIEFSRDIEPLLVKRCYMCHGTYSSA
jgi:hypothetical protein